MARLFLSILSGDDPLTAKPLVASESPILIRAVADALHRELTDGTQSTATEVDAFLRVLRPDDDPEAER